MTRKGHWHLCLAVLLTLVSSVPQSASAASDAEVKQAIARGIAGLKSYENYVNPLAGLVCYTLVAGGEPVDSEAVQSALNIVLAKFDLSSGDYSPEQHHLYEAAIDAMALEAADSEVYFDKIEQIANYIIGQQKPHGGWFYPHEVDRSGDTSITQYAILGLWAADRAGVQIDTEVYDRAINWHFASQLPNGSFVYQPAGNESWKRSPKSTMTLGAAGSLGIVRTLVFNGVKRPKTPEEASNQLAFLERLNPASSGKQKRSGPRAPSKLSRTRLEDSVAAANKWMNNNYRFAPVKAGDGPFFYYYYALERAATLNQWSELGGADWYADGVNVLLPMQQTDGLWKDAGSYANLNPCGTCFSLLFLMRATKKLIPKKTLPQELGAGTLAGGRGLPDDLTKVEFEGGRVKSDDPSLAEYSEMIAGLTNIELAPLEDVPEKQPKVDLSSPDKLIGNVELLNQLVSHKEVAARKLAAWALGKTDRIDQAGLLVELLLDEDATVVAEARDALCWIARRPNGLGNPSNPIAGRENSGFAIDFEPIIAEWKKKLHQDWKQWYLANRPYELRDDFSDPLQKKFRRGK